MHILVHIYVSYIINYNYISETNLKTFYPGPPKIQTVL
jgi:hypothetical protein